MLNPEDFFNLVRPQKGNRWLQCETGWLQCEIVWLQYKTGWLQCNTGWLQSETGWLQGEIGSKKAARNVEVHMCVAWLPQRAN